MSTTALSPSPNAAAFDPKALAAQLFDELRQATSDRVGVTRESYGPGEQKAIEIVKRTAEAHRLATASDAAANLIVTLEGREPQKPVVICASHLDSVPQGGNYDGAAGVIAGLLGLARMRSEGIVPPRTIRLMGLRGEESAWFGRAYLGSSALFGELTEEDLAATNSANGRALGECMRERGAEVDRIGRGEPLLDPGSIAQYFELHIEQGPVMVARGWPTAVVTGIRGNVRHKTITCIGEAGHSGAVPRWLRRDAVFAAAELISHLDEHWQVLLERGLDLVVTTGIIATNPAEHAMSRIPGEVSFSFEVRSQSTETLEAFYHLMRTECRNIGAARKVEFRFDRRIDFLPARMNEGLIQRLLALSQKLGLPAETIPSGAGHDASIFANAGVPSAMIFIRNDHGSHNPREAMELGDFLKGTELLYHALLEFAMSRDRITIRRPDDWHVHLRDGAMLGAVLPFTARCFARAIIMPNLVPPVTTTAMARDYRQRIRAALPAGADFQPLMTCYLTDDSDPEELDRGHREGVLTAAKLYPANATTNSHFGVTDVARIDGVLERMQRIGMPLLLHGEVTDPAVDIFDRERVFIDTVLAPLLRRFPALKIVLEHITTAEAAAFVPQQGARLAATITPHHLMINRNALFAGGIRPHLYCLPVAKREPHRLALRAAATSGAPCFFLGTDTAPHAIHAKEAECGCAGIFNAPAALQSYAQVFDEEGALDRLEAFAALNGPRFYGLPVNAATLTLERRRHRVEDRIAAGGDAIRPFRGGEEIGWSLGAPA